MRSEEAKARLPFELRRGLVLTVEESKGLEFDDTCVYNFFSDSPADREWRVLNGLLNNEGAPPARVEVPYLNMICACTHHTRGDT